MMKRACKDCIYLDVDDAKIESTVIELTCHRYAPRPGRNRLVVFPKVKLDDWCGEFIRIPQLEGKDDE